ncbi:MAG: ferric reductase-like transmembrane domain-containing protein [Actinomycetota bacterium]
MKTKTRRNISRQAGAGLVAFLLVGIFWLSRPQWAPEMRIWKAFGDSAFLLLALSLVIGPMSRFSRGWARLLSWRREAGVWFALMALVHMFLILNGWARWSVAKLFGYEFVPQLGREARLEPGFGLANLIGMFAIFWALILLATSSDRAVRFLGPPAWRWLHNGAYVIFYLGLAHAAYFLFIHFTLSFHKSPPPPDWFRIPFVLIGTIVLGLQAAAFAKTVGVHRRKASDGSVKRAKQRASAQA